MHRPEQPRNPVQKNCVINAYVGNWYGQGESRVVIPMAWEEKAEGQVLTVDGKVTLPGGEGGSVEMSMRVVYAEQTNAWTQGQCRQTRIYADGAKDVVELDFQGLAPSQGSTSSGPGTPTSLSWTSSWNSTNGINTLQTALTKYKFSKYNAKGAQILSGPTIDWVGGSPWLRLQFY
jgi:hypothetical protein